MGQRANLIVVGEADYELYYSHWRANMLNRDLFWGPKHALAFIRPQRSRADGADWLDDVWAEGGALMDPGRCLLLWWGGEDVLHEVPLRRLQLELMANPWQGWDVRWAHEGIADLADHVGVPRAQVLSPRDETFRAELDAFLVWYHEHRPHSALDSATPAEVYDSVVPACRAPGPISSISLRRKSLDRFIKMG